MAASSSEHHYPLSGGDDMVWLYASPLDRGWTAYGQYLLPHIVEAYRSRKVEPPMKGVWSGEKSIGTTHRPAIDALTSVDPDLLRRFIASVVGTGAAVSISVTRDFGAVVLTVLDGSNKHKLYPTDLQELMEALQDGIESFSPSQPPPNTNKRGR